MKKRLEETDRRKKDQKDKDRRKKKKDKNEEPGLQVEVNIEEQLLTGKKRRPKRGGCTSEGAFGMAGGLPGDVQIDLPPRSYSALSLHEIRKDGIINRGDIEKIPWTDPTDVEYKHVIRRRAARNIHTNEIIRIGMVK